MSTFTSLVEATPENSADYLRHFSEQTAPEKLVERMFDLLERYKHKICGKRILTSFLKSKLNN